MTGGTTRPFVGSVSVIVGAAGNNDSALNWEELNALIDTGWGVMNHNYDHHANHWSGPEALRDGELGWVTPRYQRHSPEVPLRGWIMKS